MGRIRQLVIDLAKDIVWAFVRPRTTADGDALVVVVHSFDGYKRFWKPAAFFTERAFAETNATIRYASEAVPMVDDPERCVFTGSGDFVTRFRDAIALLRGEATYVLYLQENIWITEELTQERLDRYVQVMQRHDLDILKLGFASLWPDDLPAIVASTDALPGDDGQEFGWFGAHDYSMGHHCSIWRVTFLHALLRHAAIFGIKDPLRQEQFTSRLINRSSTARNAEPKQIKIGIWRETPSIDYVHASGWGRITPEGAEALERFGVGELYDESIPGDVFPPARFDT